MAPDALARWKVSAEKPFWNLGIVAQRDAFFSDTARSHVALATELRGPAAHTPEFWAAGNESPETFNPSFPAIY